MQQDNAAANPREDTRTCEAPALESSGSSSSSPIPSSSPAEAASSGAPSSSLPSVPPAPPTSKRRLQRLDLEEQPRWQTYSILSFLRLRVVRSTLGKLVPAASASPLRSCGSRSAAKRTPSHAPGFWLCTEISHSALQACRLLREKGPAGGAHC
jgi:hypothetical protein